MRFEEDIAYWDNASTTKVDARVIDAMLPYFSTIYGNPSSNHAFGLLAREAVEDARRKIAILINSFEDEIIFTSGATEAINLAIKGLWEAKIGEGNHIITVKTEHKAVLSTCEYLQTKGCEVTYLNVDENGLISLLELEEAIRKDTFLIAVMYVNNETGVIQPVNEIGKIANEYGITFFSDSTQAIGKILIDVENSGIDMLSFSGHKINAPKGVGVLFKRRNVIIEPQMHGGSQEQGLRPGTYNTPLIVGIGKACEIIMEEFEVNIISLLDKKSEIEKYFVEKQIGIPNFKNVPKAPHIISITLFEDAENFMLKNSKQLIASTGSACNSHIIESSHVLKAIFNGDEKVKNVIRISI